MRTTLVILGSAVLLCADIAVAQETTGAIVGTVTSEDAQPLPGVAVTASDPGTGLERRGMTDARGWYRFPALSPAGYTVTATLDGFRSHRAPVEVSIGQATRHDVTMQIGAFSEVIEVTDQAPLLDPTTTVSGITIDTDEISSRLPVSRDVTRLSLLAPGTMPGDRTFENENYNDRFTPGQSLVSFGGAAVNESTYIVNGLNITNLSSLMGSSFVPMEFVEQAQVKTGGYDAEFGRSTGGVVNLVTKSGTNTLRGSFSAYWSPEGLQEQEPDTYEADTAGNIWVDEHNQDETRRSLEASASLGGPLLRDRLFFFAFVRWVDDEGLAVEDDRARLRENNAPYWGGKLDWHVNESHRLEATYMSDKTDVDVNLYDFDPETRTLGDFVDHGVRERGGDNAILRYSGLLSESVLLSLQAGRNEFATSSYSDRDDACPMARDRRSGHWQNVGCWITRYIERSENSRTAYRADVDWYLGRHALRAGADLETNRTTNHQTYSGGVFYGYFVNGAEDHPPANYRFPQLPWDTELVRVWHEIYDGSYDALSNAAYVQDRWAVTPSLTLKLGVRWERFENMNADGESIVEISDQYAPRLGAIWDPSGNGRSKLYGSFGVYHLPMSTTTSVFLGSRYYWDEAWYVLEGDINPDGSPEGLGEQLSFTVDHDWGVDDPTAFVDTSLEPMSQQELVLGFEQLLGANWSVGVRAVARRFDQVIEDIILDQALYEVYGLEECSAEGWGCYGWALANPGTDFNGWFDLDGDGELDPIHLTAEELKFPVPKRDYYALELDLERRFADRWMIQGSYTWSHSYGNYEGLVNSDVNQVMPYFTQTFDIAGLLEHGSGDLPNDRRHSFKAFGMYSWPQGLSAGGFFWYRTGRPINGFGMHPTDAYANWYGPDAFYNSGEPCPRGCAGTTDSTWALDLMLGYDFEGLGAQWRLRVDAFNVFDNDTVTEVEEYADLYTFEPNPSYGWARHHQPPRSVRLGFGVSF